MTHDRSENIESPPGQAPAQRDFVTQLLDHAIDGTPGDPPPKRDKTGKMRFNVPPVRESEADKDRRRLRHWVIKAVVLGFLFVAVLFTLGIVINIWTTQTLPDTTLFQTLLTPFVELIKLFSSE